MSLVVCVVVCACWLLFHLYVLVFRVGNCVHFIVICHILFESLCWLIIMSMRGGALKSGLQPSLVQDKQGWFIVVNCGSLSGHLYLNKLDESKRLWENAPSVIILTLLVN